LRVVRRKHVVVVDLGFRRLVYPLDTSFIRDLDSRFVRRWVEAGWDVENTVMLKIRYPTIPVGQSVEDPPSRLFSCLTYLWGFGKYFRTVVFSRGYFENVDEMNMRVNVWHEKQHIISCEEFLHKGVEVLSEDQIAQREVEYVRKNYGEEGFLMRLRHLKKTFESLKDASAIPGHIALLWVALYLKENYKKYSRLAYPIPVNESSKRLKKIFAKILRHIECYDQVLLEMDMMSKFEQLLGDNS